MSIPSTPSPSVPPAPDARAPGSSAFRRNPGPAVLLVGSSILALDQVTKWLVVRSLVVDGESVRVDLVRPWLGLVYVQNRGAAFGFLQGQSDLLLVIAVIVVIGIAIMFQRMMGASRLMPAAIGLIVGGAIGNIVDRIRFGYVIDFVAVGPWPRFNVADTAISTGVILMVGVVLLSHEPGPDDENQATTRVGSSSE